MIDNARDFLDSIFDYGDSGTAPPSSADRPVRLGTVDASYSSYGLARVLFDGETLIGLKGYAWNAAGGYAPIAGERVFLIPVGTSYVIGGPVSASPYPDPARAISSKVATKNGWVWYHAIVQTIASFSPAVARRTSAGYVYIDGLLIGGNTTFPATLAAGTVIANIPPAYRPLKDIPFVAWTGSGNIHIGVIVRTNGNIEIDQAVAAGTLISLSNIRYNNDASLVRTPLALLTTWANYGSGSISTNPEAGAYALDSVGRTIVEGLVQTPTASSAIATLPAAARWTAAGALWLMFNGTPANRFSRIDSSVSPGTSGAVNTSGSAIQAAQSIHHSFIRDTFATTPLGYSSGSNYGSSWNPASFHQIADGSAHLKGLAAAMVQGSVGIQLPSGIAPKYSLIFAADASDAPGRIDVLSNGQVVNNGGTNTFHSLEGLEWMPGEAMP